MSTSWRPGISKDTPGGLQIKILERDPRREGSWSPSSYFVRDWAEGMVLRTKKKYSSQAICIQKIYINISHDHHMYRKYIFDINKKYIYTTNQPGPQGYHIWKETLSPSPNHLYCPWCTFMAQSQPKMMDHLQQPFAGSSTNIILSLQINIYIYIYIIYIYIQIYIFIYIYIYTQKYQKTPASSRVQICFFHCPSGVFFPRKAAAIESLKVVMPVFLDLKCQWLYAFFWPNEIVFHQPRFSLK